MRVHPRAARYLSRGNKTHVEALWRDLFSNTSQWWDHRPEKINPRFPDFKHKQTGEALWLADARRPPWVKAQLAAIPTGTLESNAFAWAQKLTRYVKAGQYIKTIEFFRQMQQDRICPDTWTFRPVLNACAGLRALEEGKRIHSQIIQVGCDSDVCVATCLIDMYAKCGSIEDAWGVFNKMQEHDVVSWNAMIGGFVKCGHGLKARELFSKMQQEGVEPNTVTFVGMLNACASIAALEEGRHVHEQVIERRCESDVCVANCLVDMYAKCGSIEDAWIVFNKMQEHTVVSWNAMIGGCAMHGYAKKAIDLFRRMSREGVEVNGITFTCLLSSCSHGGLVKEGLRYFKSMILHYDILPTTEHYSCMVDILGRAGRLDEAEEMMIRMPMGRYAAVWRSLLAACRVHGNIEMAERAAKRCWELNPENVSGHLLLSNIYAAAGKWDRSAAVGREGRKKSVERGRLV